jgi:hypothetical protein
MRSPRIFASATILLAVLAFSLFAAEKDKKEAAPKDAPRPSYEMPQPERESLDFAMYQSIREEALTHSHIMEYASGLMDGIGPRLTGSPNLKRANEWTRDQFTAMGCSNAHLEDWGEFGMGWQQLNTWVRMTSPDAAVFIAQAAPWSPATKGPVTASAVWVDIKSEADFDKYKGKLAGKIIFFGEMREVKPVEKPLFTRDEDADLKRIESYPTDLSSGFSQESCFSRKNRPFLSHRAGGRRDHSEPRRQKQRRLWRHDFRRHWRRLRLADLSARTCERIARRGHGH